jgi:DNA-binding IclR family transcriptional regulator
MCRESVTYQHVDRSEALKLLTGQPRAEAIQTIITTFGCSKRTAQRVIKQLIVGGFVSSRRDGRSSRLTLTEQSSRHINGRFRKLMVVPTLTSITKSP